MSLFRAAVWGVDEGQLALKLALLQLQLLIGLMAVCGIAFLSNQVRMLVASSYTHYSSTCFLTHWRKLAPIPHCYALIIWELMLLYPRGMV